MLAHLDSRVQCAALIASAPQRAALYGPAEWLARAGLLRHLLNWEIRRSIGKTDPPRPVNFDPAYDAHSPRDMTRAFSEALRSIPAERGDSLMAISDSELDPAAVSVPPDLRLEIPILQVIGEVDEVWGGELPLGTLERFPNLRRVVIKGAYIHKDVFFKAEAFFEALVALLEKECSLVI
jgi:hypothetical protein